MRTLLLVLAGAGITACGSTTENFLPSERATSRSPEGYTAAEYQIQGETGSLGEVKVWSRGAYRSEVDGAPRTVLHVGFDIDNSSDEPLTLDSGRISLDYASLNDKTLVNLQPDRVVGQAAVPAHASHSVQAFFVLPHGFSPQNLDAFRVQWAISNGEITYSQRTPFLEVQEPMYAGYYYSPFYDPFLDGPYFYPPRILVLHDRPFRQQVVIR
jgi:hypothetical protein